MGTLFQSTEYRIWGRQRKREKKRNNKIETQRLRELYVCEVRRLGEKNIESLYAYGISCSYPIRMHIKKHLSIEIS